MKWAAGKFVHGTSTISTTFQIFLLHVLHDQSEMITNPDEEAVAKSGVARNKTNCSSSGGKVPRSGEGMPLRPFIKKVSLGALAVTWAISPTRERTEKKLGSVVLSF